jgi:hypothetical protein
MTTHIITRKELLAVIWAFLLVGGMHATHAVDGVPLSNARTRMAQRNEDSGHEKKRPSRSAPGSEVSISARPSGRHRGGEVSSVQGNDHKDEQLAALRAQLARQESLLAAQEQRLARLEAAFEMLNRQSAPVLRASYEPTPDRETTRATRPVAVVSGAGSDDAPPSSSQVRFEEPNAPHSVDTAALVPAPPLEVSAPSRSSAPSAQEQTQAYTTRLETLSKQVEGISKGIAGFRFSGDLRLRSDNIFRSAGSTAGPVQNVRGRYRARLNLDKGIDPQLDVHFQLGSGRFDNALTDDTDFGGGAVRGPIFLTEAWLDYHPNSTLSIRGGKMPEVFQDYTRFMWDEDVRFNGFQESVGVSPGDNPLGITRVDFRAGQYVLTNPNIQVLPSAKECTPASQTISSLPATIAPPPSAPAACAYLQAGYKPGENVRAADLFDQGIFLKGRIKPGWSHYLYSNIALYRNPNQIALTTTPLGPPLLVNSTLGVNVAGPLTGTGTATTMPGGGIYTASHFQIGHLAYRLTKEGWKFRSEDFPVFIDIQASRNFGTSFLRNAWMVTLNAGAIKKAGDVRFLYFYTAKDANSMISEFTDDHAGTLTGVNIRTHSIRFDLGLAKFLQWQNTLYIQNEISGNDPSRHFYVPVPKGTPTQYRIQSALFVNF